MRQIEETENWHNIHLRLVRCGKDLWPANLSHGKEWFRSRLVDFDFWFIWKGKGFLRDSSESVRPLRRGVCVLMKPGGEYEVWQDDHSQLGVAFFHFDTARRTRAKIPSGFLESTQPEVFEYLTSRIIELRRQAFYKSPPVQTLSSELQNQLLKTVVQEFALEVAKEGGDESSAQQLKKRQVVSESLRLLHEDFRNKVNIEAVARAAGYSRDHFHRIFKEITGQTPYNTLINIRMDRAKNFLFHSDLNIGDIADQLGFKDIFSFSKQFKQTFGCSPSAYRKRENA